MIEDQVLRRPKIEWYLLDAPLFTSAACDDSATNVTDHATYVTSMLRFTPPENLFFDGELERKLTHFALLVFNRSQSRKHRTNIRLVPLKI